MAVDRRLICIVVVLTAVVVCVGTGKLTFDCSYLTVIIGNAQTPFGNNASLMKLHKVST